MTQPHARFLGTATVTSVATFAYFASVAAIAGSQATSAETVIVRATASVLAGVFLTVRARQREEPTVAAAAADGFVLAVIVIVCNSLFGSDFKGSALAIRTVGLLTGVPALAVVAQVLARRGPHLA